VMGMRFCLPMAKSAIISYRSSGAGGKPSTTDARVWLRENGYADVAERIDVVMQGWEAGGKSTRRNWWGTLSGGADGRPYTVRAKSFPYSWPHSAGRESRSRRARSSGTLGRLLRRFGKLAAGLLADRERVGNRCLVTRRGASNPEACITSFSRLQRQRFERLFDAARESVEPHHGSLERRPSETALTRPPNPKSMAGFR
jgi:hypothetical protein